MNVPSFKTPRWDDLDQMIQNHAPVAVLFACPKCIKCDTPETLGIDFQNLDLNIRCKHCRTTSTCPEWICPCGKHWYMCHTHRCQWHSSAHSKRSKVDKPSSVNTKRVFESTYDSIDSLRDEEVKWHRQRKDGNKRARNDVILDKPQAPSGVPTKLGPILSARFKNLPLWWAKGFQTS